MWFTLGALYIKFIPAGPGVPDNVPETLSATGCFSAIDPTQPAEGLIPYDIKAPFWSDGAEKMRYIALPDGTTITINADNDGLFPPGSVVVKNFVLGGLFIETRLLIRHPDGVWAGYTYEWNAAETLATRVHTGKVRNVNGQDWIYPSEAQCMKCHTSAAGFALGPETAQLNMDFNYPFYRPPRQPDGNVGTYRAVFRPLVGNPSCAVRFNRYGRAA